MTIDLSKLYSDTAKLHKTDEYTTKVLKEAGEGVVFQTCC